MVNCVSKINETQIERFDEIFMHNIDSLLNKLHNLNFYI